MPLSLLVIYRRSTGEILQTQSGGSFRYRKQLEKLYPDIDPKDLRFYYEEADTPITPGEDTIVIQGKGTPPLLLDASGRPKAFNQFIINQAAAIQTKPQLRVECEYGCGDQIIALEAITTFQKKFPNHPVTFATHHDYKKMLSYIDTTIPIIEQTTPPDPARQHTITLNPLHRLWDPRAPACGKADFYAAHIGLTKSTEKVYFNPIPDAVLMLPGIQTPILQRIKRPLLTIHTKSVSRTASTWSAVKAIAVADFWNKRTSGTTYLCGSAKDWIVTPPWCFTLPAGSGWEATARLIQLSDLIVAIDSGPMHIARATKTPLITLWGGSGPNDILGRDLDPHDIRADYDCINELCPSCRRPGKSCMEWITPDMVNQKIISLYPAFLLP